MRWDSGLGPFDNLVSACSTGHKEKVPIISCGADVINCSEGVCSHFVIEMARRPQLESAVGQDRHIDKNLIRLFICMSTHRSVICTFLARILVLCIFGNNTVLGYFATWLGFKSHLDLDHDRSRAFPIDFENRALTGAKSEMKENWWMGGGKSIMQTLVKWRGQRIGDQASGASVRADI